jgi:hypothetical protein
MTKRRLIRWSLILVAFAAFAIWLEPTRVVWGWLRGDAFFQSRPTRWWREQLANVHVQEVWENHPLPGGDGQAVVFFRRLIEYREPQGPVPFLAKLLRVKLQDPAQLWAPFLSQADAEEVLTALKSDPDSSIRAKVEVLAHERQAIKDLPPLPDQPPVTDGSQGSRIRPGDPRP